MDKLKSKSYPTNWFYWGFNSTIKNLLVVEVVSLVGDGWWLVGWSWIIISLHGLSMCTFSLSIDLFIIHSSPFCFIRNFSWILTRDNLTNVTTTTDHQLTNTASTQVNQKSWQSCSSSSQASINWKKSQIKLNHTFKNVTMIFYPLVIKLINQWRLIEKQKCAHVVSSIGIKLLPFMNSW